MSEKDAIKPGQKDAITRSSILEDLTALGLEPGMTVLTHSSLSSLGWVAGAAQAVLLALEDSLGSRGTLVMPTHTAHLSEPSRWQNPAVPESWWGSIRDELPAYDRNLTPGWGMGMVSELFRRQKGTRRSHHPHVSFAARGPLARRIVRRHPLDYSMSKDSPLGRLYDMDARVLLLGLGYGANTCFHLAEYYADWPGKTEVDNFSPLRKPFTGERIWKRWRDIGFEHDDFPEIGKDMDQAGFVRQGQVGMANCRFFPLKDAVDFAAIWISIHRDHSPDADERV